MKYIVFFTVLFPLISFAQDAPKKIGPFEIGRTTIAAVKLGPSWAIEDIEGYSSVKVNPWNEDPGDDNLHELNVKDGDTSTAYNAVAPQCSNMRTFLVSSFAIEDRVVNNLLLRFYDDTLIMFMYESNSKLLDVFVELYRGKGTVVKDKTTQSKCTLKSKGKRFTETIIEYFLQDKNAGIESFLTYKNGVNQSCEFYSYVNVFSIGTNSYNDYEKDRKWCIEERKKAIRQEAIDAKKRLLESF